MRRVLVLAVLSLCIAALAGGSAEAQRRRGRRGDQAAGPNEYAAKVQTGIRLMMSRDFEGSVASLRQAAQIDPSNPEAFYFIGEALRLKGENDDALESFRTAARLAGQANNPRYQARGLQGIADTLERMENHFEEARIAWNEFAQFADSHRDVAIPEVGRARMRAIDTMLEQERQYVGVRERIAERERANREGRRRGGASSGSSGSSGSGGSGGGR